MYNISLWCMRICQNLDFCWTVPFFLLFLLPFFSAFLFSLLSTLHISFLLAEKVWTLSLENPEKGFLINYRCIGLFKHRFCTQNGSCFSLICSVRMQPTFKMNSPVEGSILALSAAYRKNPLTCQLMTSQVVQWPRLQIVLKCAFRSERLSYPCALLKLNSSFERVN